MELSITDKIWNRAALDSGGENALDGDNALASLLLFHGYVMNGGLGHALDVISDDECLAAIDGFRFFGFDELASFLESIKHLPEDEHEEMTCIYAKFIPNDQAMVESFENFYRKQPDAFAPFVESSRL
jgi:hypothetical protein